MRAKKKHGIRGKEGKSNGTLKRGEKDANGSIHDWDKQRGKNAEGRQLTPRQG